jgi:threonyl-tRNA synthetase
MLVIGDREIEENTVSLRKRDGSRENGMAFDDFVALLKERVETRSKEL